MSFEEYQLCSYSSNKECNIKRNRNFWCIDTLIIDVNDINDMVCLKFIFGGYEILKIIIY